ncbi:MAG: RNA 2',3'-cyclic phosphodiesterase [Candidatus Heimdallarchaeota archaeon]
MLRSFIAIELNDEETIKKIEEFSARLKQNQSKLKLVEPKNLHLTVKFLGDIPESLAPKIYKLIQDDINNKVFQGKTYDYVLKGAGQFNKFSVIWIKLIGELNLLQKVKDITEKTLNDNLKIELDKRTTFKPHLTIGRLKKNKINYKTFNTFKNLINENKNLEFGLFKINQIKLKKSVLTPRGPIYSDLVY